MTRRSGRSRPKRLAAAVAAGGMMLVPAAVASTGAGTFFPAVASLADGSVLPDAGDLLAAVRRAQAQPEDYGASGTLPDADTLSPELLAALAGPSQAGSYNLGTGAGPLASVPPGALGIPGVMLDAYLRAEQSLAASHPGCGVHWSVLAGIGRIESNHARGGAVDAQGTTVRPILGPQLSGGPGMAVIRDSDGGRLDGDPVWDRAVGPMQFIPTTWAGFAADGNGDGVASPHNVYDATVAAGRYLCAGGGNLREATALARAVFRYNHSDAYVANVLSWAAAYASGVTPLPSAPLPIGGPVDGEVPPPVTPPVDPTTPPPSTDPTSTTTPPPSTTDPTCPTPPPSGTTSPGTPADCNPGTDTSTPTPPPSSSTSQETSTQGPTSESSTAQSTADTTTESTSQSTVETTTENAGTSSGPQGGTESGTKGGTDPAATETTSSMPPS